MRMLHIGLLVSIFIAGCATTTPQHEGPPDYGSPITADEAQAKANDFLKGSLKDPYSAHIEFPSTPSAHCFRDGLILGGHQHCGYMLVAQVNAKNSFGAYIGAVPYGFFFQNGSLRLVAEKIGMVGETVIWRNL